MEDNSDDIDKFGLLSNASVAVKWLPILPLLKNLESVNGTADKALAIQKIAEFCIKTGLNVEPDQNKIFRFFEKTVSLLNNDPEYCKIVEELIL